MLAGSTIQHKTALGSSLGILAIVVVASLGNLTPHLVGRKAPVVVDLEGEFIFLASFAGYSLQLREGRSYGIVVVATSAKQGH